VQANGKENAIARIDERIALRKKGRSMPSILGFPRNATRVALRSRGIFRPRAISCLELIRERERRSSFLARVPEQAYFDDDDSGFRDVMIVISR